MTDPVRQDHQPTPAELERIDGIEAVSRLVDRFGLWSVILWLCYRAESEGDDVVADLLRTTLAWAEPPQQAA